MIARFTEKDFSPVKLPTRRPGRTHCGPLRSDSTLIVNAKYLVLLIWLGVLAPGWAADYFVATNGLPLGDGSAENPLDLATAISGTSPAGPGDTIYLRGGVYRGVFTSDLRGSTNNHVTLSGFPGERAIIDGNVGGNGTTAISIFTIRTNGSWSIYRDFEVTYSYTNRPVGVGLPAGIYDYAPYSRLLNLVVHDTGLGIGLWTEAVNSEMVGCIIYNIGFQLQNQGNGHSLYSQNSTGTKRIIDNIICNSFGFGMNIYTEGGQIRGYDLQGNICINAGGSAAQTGVRSPNIFVGGNPPAARINVVSNYTFQRLDTFGGGVSLSYTATNNLDCSVRDNVFAGGNRVFIAEYYNQIVFSNNFLHTAIEDLVVTGPHQRWTNSLWDYNQYHGGDSVPFVDGKSAKTYDNWRAFNGADAHSTYTNAAPTGTRVFLRANPYEPRRAHLAVYNWDNLNNVLVNAGSVLRSGQTFEVRNAQNLFAPPVLSGIYSGLPLTLPMTNLSTATPLSNPASTNNTGKEFNSFILIGPRNQRPTLSDMPNRTTSEDTPLLALPVAIGDPETLPIYLTVTATSSDLALVPAQNLQLSGSNSVRLLKIEPAPNRYGSARIYITVNDGYLSSTKSFLLTVLPVNDPPLVSAGTNAVTPLSSRATLVGSVQDDTATPGLTYQWAKASGPGNVTFTTPNALITGANFSVAGTYTLSLTVSDGQYASAGYVNVLVSPNGSSKAPVLSSVRVVSFTRTNAVIAWMTDKTADAQIEFGTDTLYGLSSPLDALLQTNHLIRLDNLAPDTTYHFRARSRFSTSLMGVSADLTLRTAGDSTAVFFYQPLLTEAATVTAPMQLATDPLATRGTYLTSGTANSGKASFDFYLPAPVTCIIWARVLATSSSRDHIFVSVDGGEEDIFNMSQGVWTTAWRWRAVNGRAGGLDTELNPRLFTLAGGQHRATLRCKEAYAGVDQLLITNDPEFIPSDNTPVAGVATATSLTNLVLRLTLAPGLNIVANPLDRGGNTVAETLPALPDQATLLLFDSDLQNYVINTREAGSWNDPGMIWELGEGAYLLLPGATNHSLSLTGVVRTNLPPRARTPGFSFLGSRYPQAGSVAEVLDVPPKPGDQLYLFDPRTGAFSSSSYGAAGWSPLPYLDLAEPFFIYETP